MESCFYEGTVVHARLTPVVRAFPFRLFMTYVDLAELETLFGRRGLWSTKSPAAARFRRRDYLGDPSVSLEESVRRLVEERTGRRPSGPIRLLTNFRNFGIRMNPVSFYYCFAAQGRAVETLVAEVRNTPWGETHCYVVDLTSDAPECRKELHVSPFLAMGMTYRWQATAPAERLTLRIENRADPTDDSEEATIPFRVDLAMRREPVTAWNRLRMLVRYPLQTWRIAFRIYLEAWRIHRAGVPFVPHPKHCNNPSIETQPEESAEKVSA